MDSEISGKHQNLKYIGVQAAINFKRNNGKRDPVVSPKEVELLFKHKSRSTFEVVSVICSYLYSVCLYLKLFEVR